MPLQPLESHVIQDDLRFRAEQYFINVLEVLIRFTPPTVGPDDGKCKNCSFTEENSDGDELLFQPHFYTLTLHRQ